MQKENLKSGFNPPITKIDYTIIVGNNEYARTFEYPGTYSKAVKVLREKLTEGVDDIIVHTQKPKSVKDLEVLISQKKDILKSCRCDETAAKIRKDIEELEQYL